MTTRPRLLERCAANWRRSLSQSDSPSSARRLVAFAAAGALGLNVLAGCAPPRSYEVDETLTISVTSGRCDDQNGHVLFEGAPVHVRMSGTWGPIGGSVPFPLAVSMVGEVDRGFPSETFFTVCEYESSRLPDACGQIRREIDSANRVVEGAVQDMQSGGTGSEGICARVNVQFSISTGGHTVPADDPFSQEFHRFADPYAPNEQQLEIRAVTTTTTTIRTSLP